MQTAEAEKPAAKSSGGCSSGGCSTGSCGTQMSSHDWLAYEGIANLFPSSDFVEVRFKGGRKDFFKNVGLDITIGDAVAVDTGAGMHIGYVALTGMMAELQMRKKKVEKYSLDIKSLIRIATDRDLEKLLEARNRELPTLFRTRQIVMEQKLPMKLSDIEFQADGAKATFYYSSEQRIDFRDLVRALATEFKVRVDMRQITLRQEAGRIGGIGGCGRELCCSTWITDFKGVGTSAARYQNLSLNPAKLAGQCGRLKCCLNYELDSYMAELKDIPKDVKSVQTERGEAFLVKTDIFKKRMWFTYKGENTWIEVETTRVAAIQALNRKGQKPVALTEIEERNLAAPDDALPINHDLQRMDEKYRSTGGKGGRGGRGGNRGSIGRNARGNDRNSSQRPAGNPQASTPTNAATDPRPELAPREGREQRPAREQRDQRGPRPPRPEGSRPTENRQDGNRAPRPEGNRPTQGPRSPRPERPQASGGNAPGQEGPRPPRPEQGRQPNQGGSQAPRRYGLKGRNPNGESSAEGSGAGNAEG